MWRPRRLVVLMIVVVICVIAVSEVYGQSDTPTNTQCKQWDDTFATVFQWSVFATLIGTFVSSLSSGMVFGRFSWFFAGPWRRIVFVTLVVITIMLFAVPLAPLLLPWLLGHAWFSGVSPSYLNCADLRFGATGLLWGLEKPGVAAVAQLPTLGIVLAASGFIGGLISWFSSEVINRWTGVVASVRGDV